MTTPTHFLLVPTPWLGQMVSLFRQCLLDGVDLSQSGFLVAREGHCKITDGSVSLPCPTGPVTSIVPFGHLRTYTNGPQI